MGARGVVAGVVWIPLLSGCLTGSSAPGRIGPGEQVGGGQTPGSIQRVESSSGDLTLSLSFPTPSRGAAVPMDAQLDTATDPDELTDGEISLRIQTPSGTVDQVPMERVYASAGLAYHAMYGFPAQGSYLVTAEGRVESGGEVRTASVTTRVVVAGDTQYADHRNWMMPMAVLGGLGMVVMMVVMMGN